MKIQVLIASALFAVLAPFAAQAQGVPGGMSHGFHEGNRRAGPIGAVVGTAVGGVIGGVEGVLGVNQHYGPGYGEYAGPPPRIHRHRRHARYGRRHHSRR